MDGVKYFVDELDYDPIIIRSLGLDDLKQEVMSCHACPLENLTKSFTYNNPLARIVILVERPSDISHQSRQGGTLYDLLNMYFDYDELHLTSLVKCMESEEYHLCQRFLISEVLILKPAIVICFGYRPSLALIDQPQLGVYYEIIPNQTYVLPTYSIREALEDQNKLNLLHNQLNYISQQMKGEQPA